MGSKIIKMGNPLLRQRSDEIMQDDIGSTWLTELIQQLFAEMESTGGVGVAAPQIGVNKRVFVFGTSYTQRRTPKEPIANAVLINPRYDILDDELVPEYEGCLSIPEIYGVVWRAKEIRYFGWNELGESVEKQVDGLEARIIQHETDHLDGVLFVDRIEDTRSLAFYSELVR